MANQRRTQAEQMEMQQINDYQQRMAFLGSQAAPESPQYFTSFPVGGHRSPLYPQSDQYQNRPPELPSDPVAREAVLAKQRAILERSQQRAMVLDQQDRPYVYKPKTSMPPPNIAIDTQSVERQREFQRRAYQQSLAPTQLSPHSPHMHSGFNTDGQMQQWDQYSSPSTGPGYVASAGNDNTVQYGQTSPSPTDAAFPLLRRSQSQSISEMSPTHPNNCSTSGQSISTPRGPSDVNFFDSQRRFSQPAYPLHSPLFHQQQSPLLQQSSSSSSNDPAMPPHGSSTLIDIPQPRNSNIAAARVYNHGQHTTNFIDPNLMQIDPDHRTSSRVTQMNQANMSAQQASRAMPPPAIPSTAHPHVTSLTNPTDLPHPQARATVATSPNKASPHFARQPIMLDPKVAEILAKMKEKEARNPPKTLINDKPVPESIKQLRLMEETQKNKPNVYSTPFTTAKMGYNLVAGAVGARRSGSTTEKGISTYGSGDTEMSGMGTSPIDSGWVEVRTGSAENDWVDVDEDGLAQGFYNKRSPEEKKLIDEEKKRMGRK
jgi:hypothetical protein